MKFIKANWNNLIFASYEVTKESLLPFVPEGTQLDSYNGKFYVSLVAFMFHDTRVLGVPVPFHVNFEEVNLRFYVIPKSDKSKRAVVFIKEIVPLKAIEIVANTLFHENYMTTSMNHKFTENTFEYSWNTNDEKQSIFVKLGTELQIPKTDSIEEFISEHYWGFTKSNNGTHEYEVKHSKWETSTITEYSINVDFSTVYGNEFEFLNERQPSNVCFAKGSEIEVMSASKSMV